MSKLVQQIDLTETGESLRYAEILTPGGLVRVNVNLVDTQTGQPVVVVEVKSNIHWETEVREHLGDRTDIRLKRRG